jgi:Flp pilus assembly pilin Flp
MSKRQAAPRKAEHAEVACLQFGQAGKGTHMTALIVSMTKQAIADRKGVTALEYALIASAVAALLLVGFNAFFTRIVTFLQNIGFAAPPAAG